MEVNTKFDIGAQLWVIIDNKPEHVLVTDVEIDVVSKKTVNIKYGINYRDSVVDEYKLYSTKEELLKSL